MIQANDLVLYKLSLYLSTKKPTHLEPKVSFHKRKQIDGCFAMAL